MREILKPNCTIYGTGRCKAVLGWRALYDKDSSPVMRKKDLARPVPVVRTNVTDIFQMSENNWNAWREHWQTYADAVAQPIQANGLLSRFVMNPHCDRPSRP